MIRKLLTGIAALAAGLSATAARAEWHQATSNNFVVYSQGSAADARDFAAKRHQWWNYPVVAIAVVLIRIIQGRRPV